MGRDGECKGLRTGVNRGRTVCLCIASGVLLVGGGFRSFPYRDLEVPSVCTGGAAISQRWTVPCRPAKTLSYIKHQQAIH